MFGGTARLSLEPCVHRLRPNRARQHVDRQPADANAGYRSEFLLTDEKEHVRLGLHQYRVQQALPAAVVANVADHEQVAAAPEFRLTRGDQPR